jgi:aldehyde dehydrogenase (NAD+)
MSRLFYKPRKTADMAQSKTVPLVRHASADGSFKQMLIDGKWVNAASGKHFESRNPRQGN